MSDEQFYELLESARCLSDVDLAIELTVSLPTIARWRSRKSAPHPAMREAVAGRLKKLMALEAAD